MSTNEACMPGSTRSTRPFTTLPTTLLLLSRSMWSSTNCFFSRTATRVSPAVALITISFCMPALRSELGSRPPDGGAGSGGRCGSEEAQRDGCPGGRPELSTALFLEQLVNLRPCGPDPFPRAPRDTPPQSSAPGQLWIDSPGPRVPLSG